MNDLNNQIAHKLRTLNNMGWLTPELEAEKLFLIATLKELNK